METVRKKSALIVLLAGWFIAGCNGAATPTARSMVVTVRKRPWPGNGAGAIVLSTRDYRIYSTSTNRELLKFLPGFMEASLENYLGLTQLPHRSLGKKMPIYMMGTRKEWVALSVSRADVFTLAASPSTTASC